MKRLLLALLALAPVAAAPARAQSQFEVLVLSIANKYHYEYIGVARETFEQMAKRHQFTLTWTAEPGTFDGDLKKYAAIVFLNTPGEVLNEAQRKNFEAYLRAGGGYVGVHRALISNGDWPWYRKLVGRTFTTHPYIQTGVLHVTDRGFPATMPLPDRWLWTDEWYQFEEARVATLHDVLTVDEKTYDPTRIWPGQHCEGMGEYHPIAWYHAFEGGRSFVTALGHNAILYRDPLYLEHIYGGIYWAATGRGVDAGAKP